MALFDWTEADEPPPRRPFPWAGVLASATGVAAVAAGLLYAARQAAPAAPESAPVVAAVVEASKEDVVVACAGCHPVPPPDSFPKSAWRDEVSRGFRFLQGASRPAGRADLGGILAYYERHAPEALPPIVIEPARAPAPARFEAVGYRRPGPPRPFGVAHVQFVRLFDGEDKGLDVVACDMMGGEVLAVRPGSASSGPTVLARGLGSPAHAEVVDLDRDGIRDLLVADLGSFLPTDHRLGRVLWLRGTSTGAFLPTILEAGLGRVADVEAADFDGDGDLDLVVGVFGWNLVGEVRYLENRTTDWAHPDFAPRTLDPRHGAIDVPVADLDRDGRPDFVALIAQETEAVVAFLNAGGGAFRKETIFRAPHPAYGSSGIRLVDLDKDGDLDVLYSNGDALDSSLLRPYHGVRWLENRGEYPFTPHLLASAYGAYRPQAADVDGDGDLDVVATSLLPGPGYKAARESMKIDSILLLEQVEPGRFVRHSLESVSCDHTASDLADFDGDGRVDLVTGNFANVLPGAAPRLREGSDWLVVRRNLGPPALRAGLLSPDPAPPAGGPDPIPSRRPPTGPTVRVP